MKKKLKKILMLLLLVVLIIIVVLIYKTYGTIFRDVKINDNKSIAYSSRLIKEIYNKDKNTLLSDLTLNTNLAFFYSEGEESVKKELEPYLGTDKESLINNFNNIYSRYRFANRRVSYGNSLWIDNKADFSKESKLTAKKLHFDIKNRNFNNKTTEEINRWINKKSHGKVKKVIEDSVGIQSILISTLYFNEEWKEKYEDSDIKTKTFHGTLGDTEEEFLFSEEDIYLEDETSKGFMKPYKDKGLYFIGILPKENYTIKDINIENLMKNRENSEVSVAIPEFEYTNYIDLKEMLKKMNINSLFTIGNLDSISKGSYVDKFIQKNYIKVDRRGTEAFSAAVTTTKTSAIRSEKNIIYLDKPFVFMIYDDTIDQVLFIGNINNVKKEV